MKSIFTPEDLQLIIQLTNSVEVKGLQSIQAVLQLATKCQEELNRLQDEASKSAAPIAPPPPAPAAPAA